MDTGSLGAPSSSFCHHPTLLYSELLVAISLCLCLCLLCLSLSVSVSLLPPQHSLRLRGAVRWGQASEWLVHAAGSFPKALSSSLSCINL